MYKYACLPPRIELPSLLSLSESITLGSVVSFSANMYTAPLPAEDTKFWGDHWKDGNVHGTVRHFDPSPNHLQKPKGKFFTPPKATLNTEQTSALISSSDMADDNDTLPINPDLASCAPLSPCRNGSS